MAVHAARLYVLTAKYTMTGTVIIAINADKFCHGLENRDSGGGDCAEEDGGAASTAAGDDEEVCSGVILGVT